jgi:hypothetical protein
LPLQTRAGKGLICHKPSDINGIIAAISLVANEDNVLLCGEKNSICISAKDIPTLGRTCVGNIMLKGGNLLSATKV